MFRARAGDRMFALVIETPGNYRIEVEDDSFTRRIDTIVYMRRVCDEPGTQFQCDDFTPCGGGFPIPGGECRDGRDDTLARIDTFLDAGTYYVVADAFIYDAGDGRRSECGDVELRVTRP